MTGSPSVWFIPHQDDELWMGAAISNHIHANGPESVHLVLCTDGINSGARARTALAKPAFSAARDLEWRAGVAALGGLLENTHISRWAVEDGHLTEARAREVLVWDLIDRLGPDIRVKAPSWRAAPGRGTDHVNIGLAVKRLHDAGLLTEQPRYYVEHHMRASWVQANPGVALAVETTPTPQRVLDAIAEYRHVDHLAGRYGIAQLSVATMLSMIEANPVSYRHA